MSVADVAARLKRPAAQIDASESGTDGGMVILPTRVNLPPLATNVFLVALNLAVIGVASLLIAPMRDVLTATDRRLQLHLWQLRQLVPDEARAALPVALQQDSPDCTLGSSAIRNALVRR